MQRGDSSGGRKRPMNVQKKELTKLVAKAEKSRSLVDIFYAMQRIVEVASMRRKASSSSASSSGGGSGGGGGSSVVAISSSSLSSSIGPGSSTIMLGSSNTGSNSASSNNNNNSNINTATTGGSVGGTATLAGSVGSDRIMHSNNNASSGAASGSSGAAGTSINASSSSASIATTASTTSSSSSSSSSSTISNARAPRQNLVDFLGAALFELLLTCFMLLHRQRQDQGYCSWGLLLSVFTTENELDMTTVHHHPPAQQQQPPSSASSSTASPSPPPPSLTSVGSRDYALSTMPEFPPEGLGILTSLRALHATFESSTIELDPVSLSSSPLFTRNGQNPYKQAAAIMSTIDSFSDFVLSHRVDPFSCLLGQHPSEIFLESVFERGIDDATSRFRNLVTLFSSSSLAVPVTQIFSWATAEHDVRNDVQTFLFTACASMVARGSVVLVRAHDPNVLKASAAALEIVAETNAHLLQSNATAISVAAGGAAAGAPSLPTKSSSNTNLHGGGSNNSNNNESMRLSTGNYRFARIASINAKKGIVQVFLDMSESEPVTIAIESLILIPEHVQRRFNMDLLGSNSITFGGSNGTPSSMASPSLSSASADDSIAPRGLARFNELIMPSAAGSSSNMMTIVMSNTLSSVSPSGIGGSVASSRSVSPPASGGLLTPQSSVSIFHLCVDRVPSRIMRLVAAEARRLTLEHANKLAVIDILERIHAEQFSLQDHGLIVAARSALQLFPLPKKSLQRFVKAVGDTVYAAMIELEQLGYQPTRSSDRVELLRIQHKAPNATQDAMRALIEQLNVAEARLLAHLESIMNGSYKCRLAAWWLDLISQAVSSFVTAMGYSHSVIPENYLDQPPQSLVQVRRNLAVVRMLLRSLCDSTDPFHVRLSESESEHTSTETLLTQRRPRS